MRRRFEGTRSAAEGRARVPRTTSDCPCDAAIEVAAFGLANVLRLSGRGDARRPSRMASRFAGRKVGPGPFEPLVRGGPRAPLALPRRARGAAMGPSSLPARRSRHSIRAATRPHAKLQWASARGDGGAAAPERSCRRAVDALQAAPALSRPRGDGLAAFAGGCRAAIESAGRGHKELPARGLDRHGAAHGDATARVQCRIRRQRNQAQGPACAPPSLNPASERPTANL